MKDQSKEQSILNAKELFVPECLEYVGQGFYRYLEPIRDSMISRKGLEREASNYFGVGLTLITRHEVEDSTLVSPRERVAILQKTEDYERDMERSVAVKAKKLQSKYS